MITTDYIPLHHPRFVLAQISRDEDCKRLGMSEVIDEDGVITFGAVHVDLFVEAIADDKASEMPLR